MEPEKTIVIEKRIPMPEKKFGRPAKPLPVLEMEVGDSIFVPVDYLGIASARQNISRFGALTGRKFSWRKVDGGCRIWRTA